MEDGNKPILDQFDEIMRSAQQALDRAKESRANAAAPIPPKRSKNLLDDTSEMLSTLIRQKYGVKPAMLEKPKPEPKAPGPKHIQEPIGFAGLPEKPMNDYIAGAGLTQKQMNIAHMRFDHSLSITEIAKRWGITRATVQEQLAAIDKKIQNTEANRKQRNKISQ